MSAHLIGIKQDAYRIYQPSNVKNDWDSLLHSQYDRDTIKNNYDNGVTQADATIKQIFNVLAQKGYLQSSIILILADHGEGLGERDRSGYGHGRMLYQEFIRIPLLIYDESPLKYANLTFATQIDVSPTILYRFDLAIPGCCQGESLLNSTLTNFTTHHTV